LLLAEQIDNQGFAVLTDILDQKQTDTLAAVLEDGLVAAETEPGRPGVRNVLAAVPAVRAWIESPVVRGLAEAVLGDSCFPVRVILFDKTPDANWRVPWHQDLSIAVRERIDEAPEGWGPWSEKAGVVHVQPPVAVLERMVTTRLHLDDCGVDNGPLRVLPGTHRLGRLGADAIQAERAKQEEVVCDVPRGGAIVIRPLLLHASSPSSVPGRRRVLHVEWAADRLPLGLEWFEASPQRHIV
jgi:ectoine hydroxylase-related dioxygenase (phytanoyl-CoA dioxygenase family)